jgi:hypothetical protein
MELVMPQVSRIYPALFCSAAIHRGAERQSVTTFLNHPRVDAWNALEDEGLER